MGGGSWNVEKGKAKRNTEGGKAEGAKSRAGWRGVGGWRGSNYEGLARPGPSGRITPRPLATYLLRRHE